MFDFADDSERKKLIDGLSLLGWSSDGRLTTEETFILKDIAHETWALNSNGILDAETLDGLALKAYKLAFYRLADPDVRTRTIAGQYAKSQYLMKVLPLIDQASLCFFRGYYTAALATLLIALERYLRFVLDRKPNDPDPTFRDLQTAVAKFPNSESKEKASGLLGGLYSRYDVINPTPFYFNRHGLLHGLRNPMLDIDEMNCVRIYCLFDTLALAENPDESGCAFIMDDITKFRHTVYCECKSLRSERALMECGQEATENSVNSGR